MKNLIIKITSLFPCIVKINNIEKILKEKHDILFLKVVDESSFTLSCYPIDTTFNEQKNIPFMTNIDLENLQNNNSEQTKITVYKDNFIHIELKPFLIYKTPHLKTKKETFFINSQKHEANLLIGKPCIFSISNNNSIFYKTINFDCLDIKTTTLKDFIFIEFKGNKNQILVLNYVDDYVILDHLDINNIEYSKNKITIHTPILDMAKHGKLIEYTLSKDKVDRTITLTYNNKKPTIITNISLIPYAFFEAVKIKNFKLARYYLDKDLSSALTDKHIEEYFKDFLEVVPSPLSHFDENRICLIYKDNNIFTTKEYTIELNSNKIKNIMLNE